MKNGSAMLLALVLLALAGIFWYRFDQYILDDHFAMVANTACDPAAEDCFVADCDPETDEECDASPYKKVSILASEAPSCLQEHACESFSCVGAVSCEVTFCEEGTTEEGEVCLEYEAPASEETPLDVAPDDRAAAEDAAE